MPSQVSPELSVLSRPLIIHSIFVRVNVIFYPCDHAFLQPKPKYILKQPHGLIDHFLRVVSDIANFLNPTQKRDDKDFFDIDIEKP